MVLDPSDPAAIDECKDWSTAAYAGLILLPYHLLPTCLKPKDKGICIELHYFGVPIQGPCICHVADAMETTNLLLILK